MYDASKLLVINCAKFYITKHSNNYTCPYKPTQEDCRQSMVAPGIPNGSGVPDSGARQMSERCCPLFTLFHGPKLSGISRGQGICPA